MDKRTEEFVTMLFEQVLELRVLSDALYEGLSEWERLQVKMRINKRAKDEMYLGNLMASVPFTPESIQRIIRDLVAHLA
jgi:hypothetical protein